MAPLALLTILLLVAPGDQVLIGGPVDAGWDVVFHRLGEPFADGVVTALLVLLCAAATRWLAPDAGRSFVGGAGAVAALSVVGLGWSAYRRADVGMLLAAGMLGGAGIALGRLTGNRAEDIDVQAKVAGLLVGGLVALGAVGIWLSLHAEGFDGQCRAWELWGEIADALVADKSTAFLHQAGLAVLAALAAIPLGIGAAIAAPRDDARARRTFLISAISAASVPVVAETLCHHNFHAVPEVGALAVALVAGLGVMGLGGAAGTWAVARSS